MRSAERFDVLGVRLLRKSRQGVGRGVFQPGPAKQPDDLLTGKSHGNHPLPDPGLRPSCAQSVPCPREPGACVKASRRYASRWNKCLVMPNGSPLAWAKTLTGV